MKEQQLLFEVQNIDELESINCFENKENILSKKNFFLSPNMDNLFQEKANEFEQFKKIMDFSKTEINKSDSTDDNGNENESFESIYFIKQSKIDLPLTCNTSKNISFNQDKSYIETKDELLSKNINFKTILHHKRGRKSLGKQKEKRKLYLKRYHGSSDFDNVQRKIQVNFITFLIRLANDAIKTVLGKKTKYFFKDVRYELKKVVSHKYVEKLKKCKYSDIIQMKISGKNRKYGENLNKETFLEVCKISPELKNFFEKNYLYIFQKYYYGMNYNEDIIDFDGLKVELSPLTKGFLNLIQKNESGKERFTNVVNDVYFSGPNYTNNILKRLNPFVITNQEKKE